MENKTLKITITNQVGENIILGKNDYKLTSCSGFEAADYGISIKENGIIDGATVQSSKIGVRYLDLGFDVYGRNQESQRQMLIGFFSPKSDYTIKVERSGAERMIIGKVESFSISQATLYSAMSVRLSFICTNPYFFATSDLAKSMNQVVPLIAFPFVIPPQGAVAGYRISQKEITLDNNGHVETGLRAVFKAAGGNAAGIILKNLTSGQKIEFTGTLQQGSTLEISTILKNKYVRVDRENAIHFINRQSEFFSMVKGDNVITYSASEGYDNLNVRIYFTPQYLGV